MSKGTNGGVRQQNNNQSGLSKFLDDLRKRRWHLPSVFRSGDAIAEDNKENVDDGGFDDGVNPDVEEFMKKYHASLFDEHYSTSQTAQLDFREPEQDIISFRVEQDDIAFNKFPHEGYDLYYLNLSADIVKGKQKTVGASGSSVVEVDAKNFQIKFSIHYEESAKESSDVVNLNELLASIGSRRLEGLSLRSHSSSDKHESTPEIYFFYDKYSSENCGVGVLSRYLEGTGNDIDNDNGLNLDQYRRKRFLREQIERFKGRSDEEVRLELRKDRWKEEGTIRILRGREKDLERFIKIRKGHNGVDDHDYERCPLCKKNYKWLLDSTTLLGRKHAQISFLPRIEPSSKEARARFELADPIHPDSNASQEEIKKYESELAECRSMRRTLGRAMALSAIFGDYDVNPSNFIITVDSKNLKTCNRIDFGNAFFKLRSLVSKAQGKLPRKLLGGGMEYQNNNIMDYFNREKVAGPLIGGDRSKIWRDYVGVVPSQELLDALREFSSDNSLKIISEASEMACKEIFTFIKMIAASSLEEVSLLRYIGTISSSDEGDKIKRQAKEKLKEKAKTDIINLLKSLDQVARNCGKEGIGAEIEGVFVEGDEIVNNAALETLVNKVVGSIFETVKENIKHSKEVVAVMEDQLLLNKAVELAISPTSPTKLLSVQEEQYLGDILASPVTRQWIKTHPGSKPVKGTALDYVREQVRIKTGAESNIVETRDQHEDNIRTKVDEVVQISKATTNPRPTDVQLIGAISKPINKTEKLQEVRDQTWVQSLNELNEKHGTQEWYFAKRFSKPIPSQLYVYDNFSSTEKAEGEILSQKLMLAIYRALTEVNEEVVKDGKPELTLHDALNVFKIARQLKGFQNAYTPGNKIKDGVWEIEGFEITESHALFSKKFQKLCGEYKLFTVYREKNQGKGQTKNEQEEITATKKLVAMRSKRVPKAWCKALEQMGEDRFKKMAGTLLDAEEESKSNDGQNRGGR